MVAVKAIADLPLEQACLATLGFIQACEFVQHYPAWEAERAQRTASQLRVTTDELLRHRYTNQQKAAVVVEFNRQCGAINRHVSDNRLHYHLARAACELYTFHPTAQLLQSIQAAVQLLQRPYNLS